MGSFAIEPSGTNQGQGTVTLVAPTKITIDGPGPARRTATFTTLRMSFLVPEPRTLLLLGAGALALTYAARRR